MENSKLINDETVKAIVGYLVPLVLAFLISFLGKFLGFIFSEIFSIRRLLILFLVFLLALYVSPAFAGWITLGAFLTIIGLTLLGYFLGPRRGPNIIFAGFYDISGANGYFSRTGASKVLDAQFFRTFYDLLHKNSVQKIRPMAILAFKPPALIYSWCDYERFESLIKRYVKKSFGVIWGTVNKDGHLQTIEIKLNIALYHGKDRAEETINDAIETLNNTDLRSEEKIKFFAQLLAAIWGNSFSNDIAKTGNWERALHITKESQLIFEKATSQLERLNKQQTSEVIKFLNQSILPTFYVEEARNRLHGKQYEEAIEHLVRTILLNPFFPFHNGKEFLEFYLAAYQAKTTAAAPLKDEMIHFEMSKLSEKAMFDIPPHLQLLLNWLYETGGNISNLNEKIERWFTILKNAFPENPFIFLYWAEAIKVPSRLGLTPNLEPGPEDRLPIEIMDRAIAMCEAAYALAPDIYVISTRISMMSFVTSFYFEENSEQQKKRRKKFEEYAKKAAIHMNDFSRNWSHNNQELIDWDKFGMTKEEFEELRKSDKNL